jgi:hypothetical protein
MAEKEKASGPSQQNIDEAEQKAKQFRQTFKNPTINAAR